MAEERRVLAGATTIPYRVERSSRRRKTVQISVDPAAGVLVRAPLATAGARLDGIVAGRAAWILRRLAAQPVVAQARQWVSGETLPYLGRRLPLRVEETERRRAALTLGHAHFTLAVPRTLAGSARAAAVERVVVRWYRAAAADCFTERVARWAAVAGYAPARVLARDQRRRWGSCAPDGTLRFNWRLVLAEPAVIDYVVVHELAHLRAPNHGPAFWAEVGRLLPEHRQARARLRAAAPDLRL